MPDVIPDTERVRAFLRQRCPLDLVDRLELTYLKVRRDGTGGKFLYEARGARHAPLRVSACHVPPEKGPGLDPGDEARHARPLYSPDLQLLFRIFPADRKLESLRTLTDGEAMASVLQGVSKGAPGATVRNVAVQVVRYKPERKCVLRYDLEWTVENAAPSVVFAKATRPPDLGRTPRLLAAIRESGGASGFDLPESLASLPRLGAEVYSAVPGTPLSALCEAAEFPWACRRAGRALRQFHALPVAAPRRTAEAKLEQLERNAGELLLLLPSDAERIDRLRRRMTSRLQAADSPPPCLVHGDFHGDNVLVDRAGVGLVDLDDCAIGNPAEDLGSMWAQLTWLSFKRSPGPPLVERGRQAFLEGYLDQGPEDTAAGARVEAARHCFLFAYQCLRRPAPARREQAQALLTVSEEILEKGLP